MICGTECWAIKKQYICRMGVTEMRILRWISRNTRKDRIRNEEIRLEIMVAEIDSNWGKE